MCSKYLPAATATGEVRVAGAWDRFVGFIEDGVMLRMLRCYIHMSSDCI